MPDIFISYASEDRNRVAPIVAGLESAGYEVWWDRRIGIGASFDREIERAIENSRCVLVVWTQHAVESDWVRSEAQEGLNRNILVPVLLDDIAVPLAFRRTQTADLVGWRESSEELYGVYEAVGRIVGRDAEEAPRSASKPANGDRVQQEKMIW